MKKLMFVAALVALLVAVPFANGLASRGPVDLEGPNRGRHRHYAFTAKDAPGDLTIVGNRIPFEDPAGGPNFYQFDDNAHYYLFGE